jgi:hypothetical protein
MAFCRSSPEESILRLVCSDRSLSLEMCATHRNRPSQDLRCKWCRKRHRRSLTQNRTRTGVHTQTTRRVPDQRRSSSALAEEHVAVEAVEWGGTGEAHWMTSTQPETHTALPGYFCFNHQGLSICRSLLTTNQHSQTRRKQRKTSLRPA